MQIKSVFFLLFISCSALVSRAQVLQVVSLDPKLLLANKEKIAQRDASILPAYLLLLKDADKALKEGPFSVMEKKNDPPSGDKHDYMSLAPYFWPDPTKPNGMPYIRKDGQTNPEVKEYKDKEYMPRLCELVNTLSLAYFFSGKEMYAEHAARLTRVWFLDEATKMNPNLNYGQAIKGVNDGRGAGLIDARHFIKLIDGLGLLKNSKSWSATDEKGMKQWFSSFLTWMETSKNGVDEMKTLNNHGTWYDALRLSQSLYIGDVAAAKRIVANLEKRLDSQMDEEGRFPKEMERTTSLHYSLFDLEAFFLAANMAEKIDMDLWNHVTPSGKTFIKAFSFLKPFLTKEKEWTGQQIKPFDFEEGYPVLLSAAKKLNCKDCIAAVAKLSDKEWTTLRYRLIY